MAAYKGAGRKECGKTGCQGRVGAYEFLLMGAKLKRLIGKNAPEEEMWKTARKVNTVTLFEDAWSNVNEGVTTEAAHDHLSP